MNIYSDEDNFGYTYKCNTFFGLFILFLFVCMMLYSMYNGFEEIGNLKTLAAYDNDTATYITLDLLEPSEFPIFF